MAPDADPNCLIAGASRRLHTMAWKLQNIGTSRLSACNPDVISAAIPATGTQAGAVRARGGREKNMSRMLAMWLFGVPVSVVLLFVLFGVI
jgi:hypothetical protein